VGPTPDAAQWRGLTRISAIVDNTRAARLLESRFTNNDEEKLMGILMWLLVGGVVGWLASLVMRRDASMGVVMNIVVGIIGALLGGWLIGPMVGAPSINSGSLTAGSLLVSFLGAVILLAIVNLFTRRRVR
jgi:uncharacterized membrane protein YeaQ/YmgE (transglycosylase-associated protein family)